MISWFQKLLSNGSNLYRYAEDGRGGESKAAAAERGREVGLYKLTHSLKAPWFQPLIL